MGSFRRELPLLVLTALVRMFLASKFLGPRLSDLVRSMEPTLRGCQGCSHDRVLVDKLTYRFLDPRSGDRLMGQ
jgi:signal peptidase I